MVKQRMTTADVAAEVACLRRLVGMRVGERRAAAGARTPAPQPPPPSHQPPQSIPSNFYSNGTFSGCLTRATSQLLSLVPAPVSPPHPTPTHPPLTHIKIALWAANVYDLSPRTYVLKLARSGEDGDKALLLVESGVRLHTVPVRCRPRSTARARPRARTRARARHTLAAAPARDHTLGP